MQLGLHEITPQTVCFLLPTLTHEMWMKTIFLVGIASAIAAKMHQPEIERFFMRFFRDLSRAKAYKRRFGTDKGLVAMMTDTDPLGDSGVILNADEEDESNLQSYTLEELLEFGDGKEGRPVLVAVFGKVYDVSSGHKFYGPEGRYPMYGGREITFALATACTTLECAETQYDFPSLTSDQQVEAERWLSFFHLHDKYSLVGHIEQSPWESIFESELDHKNQEDADEVMRELASSSGCTNPNFADDNEVSPKKPTTSQDTNTESGNSSGATRLDDESKSRHQPEMVPESIATNEAS